jgi:hypothetical protein
MSSKKTTILYSFYILFISQLAYSLTLYPDIFFSDSAELLTSTYTLGISHPTGYSLYTLLNHLISRLGSPDSAAVRVNFITGLYGSFALILLFLNMNRFFLSFVNPEEIRQKISLSVALFTGFTELYWSQCVLTEVYSLEWLFILGLIYLVLLWEKEERDYQFYIICILFGAGFTHHLLTIILIPSLCFILFYKIRKKLFSISKTLFSLGFFLLGYSIVLYLPVRASYKPVINWWNPVDVKSFFNLLTGGQYQLMMFSDQINPSQHNVIIPSFVRFIFSFFQQLNMELTDNLAKGILFYGVGLIFITFFIMGLIKLFQISRKLTVFILLIGLVVVVVVTNYHIQDIDSYYTPGFIVMMMFIGIGFSFIIENIQTRISSQISLNSLIFFPFILAFLINYSNVSPYVLYGKNIPLAARFYAVNTLKSVENDAVIFTGGDYDIMPLWYGKYVLGLNKGITIFGTNFLSSSWYKNFFLNESYPFSFILSDQIFPTQAQFANALISNIVNPNIANRPLYITYNEPAISSLYKLLPVANILPDYSFIPQVNCTGMNYLYKINADNHYLVDNQYPDLVSKPLWSNGKTELYSVSISPKQDFYKPGDLLELTYIWKIIENDAPLECYMLFKNNNGEVLMNNRFPLFIEHHLLNIDNTTLAKGIIYTEKKRITIPLSIPEGRYSSTIILRKSGEDVMRKENRINIISSIFNIDVR